MSANTIDRAELDIGPERLAEFRKLAKLAGLPLSERITKAILQALAAGVTPTGLATVVAALLKKQTTADKAAAAANDGPLLQLRGAA